MGALRINLTNGTSTFIDLTAATEVSTAEHNPTSFIIKVDSTDYIVQRFGTENTDDSGATINNVVWENQMLVAYKAIALDPIRYGYPNLGTDYKTYIQYDDEKFLASAIDSALSNIAEPAVLSNRTARASQVTTAEEGKALSEEIEKIGTACVDEAASVKDACIKAVTDPACVAPGFDFGGIFCACGDEACCYATQITYTRNCIDDLLDSLEPIVWNHQYLFEGVSSEGPGEGEKSK